MKRIILLFTVAAMMAMMALVMGAGPALAQDLDPFQAVFGDEEDDDVQVIVCDSDEGDVERVGDVVVVFCDEDDDDDDDDDDDLIDVLFDRHDDDDHRDWWRGRD